MNIISKGHSKLLDVELEKYDGVYLAYKGIGIKVIVSENKVKVIMINGFGKEQRIETE